MRYNGELWTDMGRRGFTQEGSDIIFAGIDEENNLFMLLPDSSQDGHISKLAYGEFEAENTTTDDKVVSNDEKETSDQTTTDAIEKADKSKTETPQDKIEDDSPSNYVVVLLLVVVVLVIIVVIILVMKRRKKDEESEL